MPRSKLLPLPAFLSLVGLAWAGPPDPELVDAVMAGASKFESAMLAGRHEEMLDLMHPEYVRIAGGREEILRQTAAIQKQVAARGMTLVEYEVGRPDEIYEADTVLIALLPTRGLVDAPSAKITQTGYLIAIRPKDGGPWRFVDGSGVSSTDTIQGVFSGFPADARLPPVGRQSVPK